jgi:hypothetical protein
MACLLPAKQIAIQHGRTFMNRPSFSVSGGGVSGDLIALMISVCFLGCARHQGTPLPVAQSEDSQVPAEFVRRGLSLLQQQDEPDFGTQGESLKADALIMRAWNLQQAFPESCQSVWQLTKTLIELQPGPGRKLGLASLYLGAVDAAAESAMTPKSFEASWAVRQAVLEEIGKHRLDALASIQDDAQEALDKLSQRDANQMISDEDAARLSSLAAELSATIDPRQALPESMPGILQQLAGKLTAVFDDGLADLRTRLKTEANAPPAFEERGNAESPAGTARPGLRGPITRLLEELEILINLRESAAVSAWSDIVTALGESDRSASLPDADDAKAAAMEALRAKMLEMRVLRYNLWAADTIYNADRRGAEGLLLLGAIDTRLLASAVGSSYSITEGKILNAIQDPFTRQNRIREMLSDSKRAITEF